MILSTTDIELLRLAGWCKNLPSDMYKRFGTQVLSPQIIGQMESLGLIGLTRNKNSFRLWERGWKLLRYLGYDYHRDAGYVADYKRRIEIANILLTFYRAGYDVFAKGADDLAASQVFLQSPAARRDSSAGDLWGGAGFHGIASIGEFVSTCYFITGHEDARLHRRNERLLLDRAAAMLHRRESQIFAGSDYLRLAKILRKPVPKDDKGKSSKCTYAEMYQNAPCPLYILECSDAGALQLLIMSQEQYRKRLSRAIICTEPTPPVGVWESDGEVVLSDERRPLPLILAVDMDVKRIDRALRQAMDTGYTKLLILCLEEQKKALQYLYEKDGRARVLLVTRDDLTETFGEMKLYEPEPAAYFDLEGSVLDAANLPVDRKAGEQI